MAFDNTIQANPFADNGGGNFVASDNNSFVFNADGDWMDMSGWTTFWMSTFQPNKYKEKRDAEVQEGLVDQYKLSSDASCKKINSTIDKMENRLDKEANSSPGGRGGKRMQGRILKGIEAPLNKGYNLAEEKCCEFSVCDSNKDRGRPTRPGSEDDNGNVGNGGDSSGGGGTTSGGGGNNAMDDAFKLQLLAALQQRSAPEESEESSMGMKIGLGVGAVVILGGMAYLIFGK
jgi:hypothetical protein